MHKRKANFDPLKFTPSTIHNKIYINIDDLKEYFKEHTLKECSLKYKCSPVTIKRKLRSVDVDTSIHNHSKLSAKKSAEASINGKNKPTEEELYSLLVEKNLDSKTIAEMYGLHYNTIRSMARKQGIKKSHADIAKSMQNRHMLKHGVMHPAQRPDVIAKTSISLNKVKYNNICFKSLTEFGYALLLNKMNKEWYYEEMRIPYVDMMTGKRRIYVIDFTVVSDEKIEWIEIKPNNKMIPEDKRIYAERRAEEANVEYRGIDLEEREDLWKLIVDGYDFDNVEFLHRTPRSTSSKITYYFKNQNDAVDYKLDGWRQFTKPTNEGALWKKILVRK